MDFSSILFSKNNEILKEAFTHISKYSSGEIIITDEKFNILFQNSRYIFKDNKFNILNLTPEFINQNLKINFENFKNSEKNHLFLKLIFNDKKNIINIPIEVHICKIRNKRNTVKGYSIIIQDITQEIKNRIQKETFIDIITHDLKNPIRANIQVLELIINNKFGEIEENVRTILDELLNSCKFINYMADNLLIRYKNEFNTTNCKKRNIQ